jgi:hypothetical protein
VQLIENLDHRITHLGERMQSPPSPAPPPPQPSSPTPPASALPLHGSQASTAAVNLLD